MTPGPASAKGSRCFASGAPEYGPIPLRTSGTGPTRRPLTRPGRAVRRAAKAGSPACGLRRCWLFGRSDAHGPTAQLEASPNVSSRVPSLPQASLKVSTVTSRRPNVQSNPTYAAGTQILLRQLRGTGDRSRHRPRGLPVPRCPGAGNDLPSQLERALAVARPRSSCCIVSAPPGQSRSSQVTGGC
jgi:hypothetical protein